jgi:hypothetical protein
MRSVVALCLLAGCIVFDGGGQSPPPIDGPPAGDGPPTNDGGIDAPIDAATFECRLGYNSITNGQVGHQYKVLASPAIWTTQQAACAADGTYLAIPDSAAELGAFAAATGVTVWVGVSDRVTENEFVDTKGAAYNALSLAGNNNADDCVLSSDGTVLDVDACGLQAVSLCECEN